MAIAANVFWMLDRSAQAYGEDPAIVFGDATLSFRGLRDRAANLANGLRALGVAPGDRVAVLLSNRLEWPEAFFALAAAGAICVPVNVLLAPPEIAHVMADSGARAMIFDELGAEALAAMPDPPRLLVAVGGAQPPAGLAATSYERLFAASAPADPPAQPGAQDVFIYYYSSGTTGLPKAAMHTHDGVLWNSVAQIDDLKLDRSVTYLIAPSFSWAAGFHNLVLALLWVGGVSVIAPTGGGAGRLIDAIEAGQATHVMLVPTLIRQIAADQALLARLRATRLRWVVTGAEPVPMELVARLSAALPDCRVCQGYGLSEFPTICTVLSPDEALARNGSAGRALSHTTLAVMTDAGEIRRSGRGELLIRSPATMTGYHNAPEKTADAFIDGWLRTGDLAEVDADGYAFIVGRTKDMIISGGLNIYPKEVEDVLHALPGVVEAAVVGAPDDRFGERAVAVVVARPGAEPQVAMLETACRERLAGYKAPRDFLVRHDPLPRSPTGKVLKRELRPWVQARLASRPRP
jgi:acyl-CoA synthetase (AMP-forming)/AMP-acid ligase II